MLVDRMIRAAMLDSKLYEEVEHDQNATTEALTVVAIASVAGGIGASLGSAISGTGFQVSTLIFGVIFALIGWVIWSLVVYFVGTNFFGGQATLGEVLRTVGYAYSPNTIAILAFIPLLGGLIAFVASIWALVAMIIGVRASLDVTTGKAVLTALIGWIIMIIVIAILAGIVGVAAMGVGALSGGM